MRIGFIGCVESSARFLTALLNASNKPFEVVGVVTLSASKLNADFVDLTPMCRQFNVPLHYEDPKDRAASHMFLSALKPDVVFCMGWSHLLADSMLSLAPLGVVGFHPAKLPQNRGRHPIVWALALGLTETASTLFQMDAEADSGPILSQVNIPISTSDDANTLYQKILAVGAAQVIEVATELATDSAKPIVQDHQLATSWRKRSRSDGLIDWRMHAQSIYNLVRALTRPYPGAEFRVDEHMVQVWRAAVCATPYPSNAEPGKVLAVENGEVIVKCGLNTALRIKEMSPMLNISQGDYL